MKLTPVHTFLLIKLTIFTLLGLQPVKSFHQDGNVIYDLEYTGSSFVNEVAAWSNSAVNDYDKWSVCAGYYLIGGYGILAGDKGGYFMRTYYTLPLHNLVTINFLFFPIDSWDGSTADDHFEIEVDGHNIYAWRLSGFAGYAQPLCGGSWNDYPPFTVALNYPHSSTSSITLKVINMLDQGSYDESMGFRDVVLTFSTVANPAYSLCGKAEGTPLPDKICSCNSGTQYMNPPNSGNCFDCDYTCTTCDAGGSSGCTSCPSNRYLTSKQCLTCSSNCLTCNGGGASNCLTCTTSNPYMVNGNTCMPTCDYPLYTSVSGVNTNCLSPCSGSLYALSWNGVCSADCDNIFLRSRTSNTFRICDYPCATNGYLYWDGVCDTSCPSPLKVRDFYGRNYCDHGCTVTSNYVYWDGQCESFCNYPLTYSTTHNRKICNYPCASNQYLYWDQYCGTTCFFPQVIRIFHGKQFCDFPCSAGQFLYWNNTCLSSCPYPLVTRTDRGVNYCDYPCSGSQFLYWNGSCLANCNSPPLTQRIEGSSRFCDYPCQSTQILHWTGSCVGSCLSPRSYRSEGTPARLFCYYPCLTTQYLYWNGTCSNTCNAPLTTVYQESRNFCQYPCSAGYFLYWNGSCKDSCSAPLVTRVEASLNYCDYPCAAGQYLYWNGSCIAGCASPLVQRTTDGNIFCDYPCTGSNYLYWDGICRSACDFPVSPRVEATKNYCDYPCTGSNYLYWNGSCISTCPLFSPRTSMGKQFCDFQCASTAYIYWDSTCSDYCAFPLTHYTEGSPMVRKFCQYPCATSQYLYDNGTCANSCDFPLSKRVQNNRNFCSLPCAANLFLYWNGSCIATCPSPLVTRIEGSSQYCDYPCQTIEYLYWNGTCMSSCASPLVGKLVNGNQFCYYPCTDTTRYLYWDGSCYTTCNAPLTPVIEGTPTRKYCQFGCNSNEYLYWNGSCVSTCAFPLTYSYSNSRYYCNYPCGASQFLYWDQACGSSCPSPLVTRVEGSPSSRNYCDYPCATNQYLYWNSSCISSCPNPLTVRYQNSRYFCDYTCLASQYLYWDKSCGSTCDAPHVTRGEDNKNYCDYPCASSEYLYWNGSCIASCPSPLIIRHSQGKNYCDYPCAVSQYLYWNSTCFAGCAFPLVTKVEASRNYCIYPCTSSEYLYWNGSCISTCAKPLDTRIEAGSKKYCDYKCSASQILQWDGVCTTTCDSPRTLVVEGTPSRNFCTFTCQTNEFLYWNGTCASTCKFPLVNKAKSSRLFCEYPCDVSQFLNWNGSCIASCPLPYSYRREAERNYCDYPCLDTQFLYWNGSCINSCNTPLTQRLNGTRKFCDFPCANPTDYLFWDGGCASTCPYPLTEATEGIVESRKYCTDKCANNEYLYWNGTCATTCTSPLTTTTIRGKKICNFPCDTSKYLYWDGSCSASCALPLTSKVEGGRKFCIDKCAASEYLYWDGTCRSTCDSIYTMRAEKGNYFCDYPCDADKFLFWNGTCSATCDSPFLSRSVTTFTTRKFCDFPCGLTQFWQTWSNTCGDSCASPYLSSISSLGRYCNLPCNTSEYYFAELGRCMPSCDDPYIKNTDLPYLQCSPSVTNDQEVSASNNVTTGGMLFNALFVAPVGNGTLTLVKVVKAMTYMRYLDIKLPPRLERLGNSKGRGIMSIQSSSRLLEKIDSSSVVKSTLPSVFTKYNSDTSFVVNFWGTILFIICAIGSAIILTLLELISKKQHWELAEQIFKRLRVIVRWNLGFMLIASSIDDIILYSSLQFRGLGASNVSSSDYVGVVLAVIFIILVALLMVGVYIIVTRKEKSKKMVSPEKAVMNMSSFEKKWQDVQVLFRGFKDNNKWNPYFYLIYMIRIGFPMLITVSATGSPMIIIITQVIVSVIILAYILKMKPFKKRVNQVQLVIYELTVLIMNFCMFLLTIFSVTGNDGGNFSIVIGDIVILAMDWLNLINIIFFVVRCVMEFKAIKKHLTTFNSKKKIDRTAYIQLLSLAFQQTNMGFEELIEDYTPEQAKQSAKRSPVDNSDLEIRSMIVDKTAMQELCSPNNQEDASMLPPLEGRGLFATDNETVQTIPWGHNSQKKEKVNESVFVTRSMLDTNPNIAIQDSSTEQARNPKGYARLDSEIVGSPLKTALALDKVEDMKVLELEPLEVSPVARQKKKLNRLGSQAKVFVYDEARSNETLNRSQEKKTNGAGSPVLKKQMTKEKLDISEIEENKVKSAAPVMPSVYQVVVPKVNAPAKTEAMKKFLTYNWQDLNSKESEQALKTQAKVEEIKEEKESAKLSQEASPVKMAKLQTFEWNNGEAEDLSSKKEVKEVKGKGKNKK